MLARYMLSLCPSVRHKLLLCGNDCMNRASRSGMQALPTCVIRTFGYDAFGSDHNGQQFSTIDRDNDLWSYGNCAAWRGGGFWWWNCGWCVVNGAGSTNGQFYWAGLPGGPDLQLSRMWLECK